MTYLPLNKKSGATLIEVVISLGIVVLAALGVTALGKSLFSFSNILSISLGGQDEARQALKLLTAEMRNLSLSGTGSYPILDASSTTFTFYSDANADGVKERIRYFVASSTLKRGVIVPTGNPLVYNTGSEVITDKIHYLINGASTTLPIFAYYDTNYAGTTSPLTYPINLLAIRLVKVNVVIDRDPTKSPSTLFFTTQVSLRNLKDNL